MVAYITAVYKGGRSDLPFTKGQQYSLATMKHWWSKKIHVYKRRGYYDAMQEGTLHQFVDQESFEKCWKIKEIE